MIYVILELVISRVFSDSWLGFMFLGPYCDPQYANHLDELTLLGATPEDALKSHSYSDWDINSAADTLYS